MAEGTDTLRSAIAINTQVPDYYYVLGLMQRKLGNERERESEEALAKYGQLQEPAADAGRELPDMMPWSPSTLPSRDEERSPLLSTS